MVVKVFVEGYSVLVRGISLRLSLERERGGNLQELMKKDIILKVGGKRFHGFLFSVNIGEKTRLVVRFRKTKFFVLWFLNLVGTEVFVDIIPEAEDGNLRYSKRKIQKNRTQGRSYRGDFPGGAFVPVENEGRKDWRKGPEGGSENSTADSGET